MKLLELTDYLDEYLQSAEYEDSSLNGLQVGDDRDITKVALAVDCAQQSIEAAGGIGAQLLLVHHGLLWTPSSRIVGYIYRRIKALMDYNIALYASHLPLDAHPEVGNNAQLAKGLELVSLSPFAEYHGKKIGFAGRFRKPKKPTEVQGAVGDLLNCQVTLIAGEKELIEKVGVVSGGGAFALDEAISQGIDLLIVGEPSHEAYHPAAESGLALLFAGHYATETLGLKALGEHIAQKFKLEAQFLDIPTGL